MEANISIWLKDHLGLAYMCEADVTSLMYHPRHGNLCRKLLEFLCESTLCSQKYPHVHVEEEYERSMQYLKDKTAELKKKIEDIEIYIRDYENEERELTYLRTRLKLLRNILETQQKARKDLEDVVNRPNWGIDLVSRKIDEIDYLNNEDLQQIYAPSGETDMLTKTDDQNAILTRRMASLDDELNDLLAKTDIIHRALSKLLGAIASQLGELEDENIQMPEMDHNKLEALKIPPHEVIELDSNTEGKKLKDQNVILEKNVQDLLEQVTSREQNCLAHRSKFIATYKEQLEKCLSLLRSIPEGHKIKEQLDCEHWGMANPGSGDIRSKVDV